MRTAQVKLMSVPYQSISGSLTAVVSGEVPLLFTSISSAWGQAKTGRARALAVTGTGRSPAAPQVPTMAEALRKVHQVGDRRLRGGGQKRGNTGRMSEPDRARTRAELRVARAKGTELAGKPVQVLGTQCLASSNPSQGERHGWNGRR
jgi:hypothetical protein